MSLLAVAQGLAFCAGSWEGAARPGDRSLLTCAVGPATLIAAFMVAGFYFTPTPLTIFVLLPTTCWAGVVFVPTCVAVMIGNVGLRADRVAI